MNLRKQIGSILESYPLVKKHIFRKNTMTSQKK